MQFKQFLIETSIQEKEQLKTIIQKLIDNDNAWFQEKHINVGDKGHSWILNYSQIGGRNEFNHLVRGLIVEKPSQNWNGDQLSLIKSFPLTRFYNLGEKEAAPVNMNNAEMLEKLDGTLVCCYFPTKNPNDPHWHTRRMMSNHPDDLQLKIQGFHSTKDYEFLPLIGKYVKQLNFTENDIIYTLVFEFIHEASMVWTKYTNNQYGLYLLAGRNLITHNELSEKELDELSQRLNCRRPRRWDSIADHSQILALMKDIAKDTPDFEGFVFRDKETGKRIKVKDPNYVKMHHLLGNLSYKNIIPKVIEGEAEEIISYFPLARERIKIFTEKFNKFAQKIKEKITFWQNKNLTKKELALQLIPSSENKFIKSMIMKFYETTEDLEEKIVQQLKQFGTNENVKKLIELLRLKED